MGNNDLVKPLALVSLRNSRNRQRHWNLITSCGWVQDLDREGWLACRYVCTFVFIWSKKNSGRKTLGKRKHDRQDTAPLLKANLELQHVTAVVTDLNTECVDVRRLWPTTAPVLLVPSDI